MSTEDQGINGEQRQAGVDLGAEGAKLPDKSAEYDAAKVAAMSQDKPADDGPRQAQDRAGQGEAIQGAAGPISDADMAANQQRQATVQRVLGPRPVLDMTDLPAPPVGGIEAYFEAREARIAQWVHELMDWHAERVFQHLTADQAQPSLDEAG